MVFACPFLPTQNCRERRTACTCTLPARIAVKTVTVCRPHVCRPVGHSCEVHARVGHQIRPRGPLHIKAKRRAVFVPWATREEVLDAHRLAGASHNDEYEQVAAFSGHVGPRDLEQLEQVW